MTRILRRVRRAVQREAVECLAAVRAAPPRTVVAESLTCLVAAVVGLLPLLIVEQEQPVLVALAALWVVLLVPARRRRPVATVLGTVPLIAGPSLGAVLMVPLIVGSATRRIHPARRAWYAVGAACALGGALTVVVALFEPDVSALELAFGATAAVPLLALPALAGTLLGRRRPLVSLLRERNAYLEQARSLSAAAARTEERNRIAGEMHDLLGHRLSLISVHAGALELAVQRQAAPLAEQAELLRTTAGSAMDELREILGVLRHGDVGDGAGEHDGGEGGRGTREDITALVAETRRAGVEAGLDWSGPDTADAAPRTRQAVHRVVREALTNALKHAPGAPVRVEVGVADGRIGVVVTNGAPGVKHRPGAGNRSGLAGLEERISLLDGSFAAGPLAGGGFRVTALLPARPPGATPSVPPAFPGVPAAPAAPAVSGRPAVPAARAGKRAGPPSGAHDPLSAEALTWPRVLGAGCAAALAILPTVVFLIVLVVLALSGQQL